MYTKQLSKFINKLICKLYKHKWRVYAIANIKWDHSEEVRKYSVCDRCGDFK